MSRKLIYLEIVLALLAIAMLIASEVGLNRLSSIQPNLLKRELIEKRVEKRIEKVKQKARYILRDLDQGCDAASFERILSYLGQLPQDERFEILIFKDGKLCFWSSNIDIDEPKSHSDRVKLVKINSSFYLSMWQAFNQKNIEANILIHVADEYPYQNKFLTNRYSKAFKILANHRISKQIESYCIPIRPKNVEPFYLIPKETSGIQLKQTFKAWMRYIAVLILMVLTFVGLNNHLRKSHTGIRISLFVGLIVGLRLVMLKSSPPISLPIPIFEPELYAHTWYNPSLGDFLLNSILWFLIVIFAFKHLQKEKKINLEDSIRKIAAGLSLILAGAAYAAAHFMLTSLVNHSTIPLETSNIFNLNIYSVIGYAAVSLWILAAIALNILWLNVHMHQQKQAIQIYIIGIFITALLFVWIDEQLPSLIGTLWFFSISCLLYWNHRHQKDGIGTKLLLLLAAITSIYLTLSVWVCSSRKEIAVRKVIAVNMSSERDPLAEMLLPQLYQNLITDSYARICVKDIQSKDVELYDYLRRNYFKDYLNRYELRASVCLPNSTLLNEQGEKISCNQFYEKLISSLGVILPGSRFYFISTQTGYISYLGIISYRFEDEVRNLYIELDSRPSWELLGYPELLIEGRNRKVQLKGYSWAKYHYNKLITKSGAFEYKLNLSETDSFPGTFKQYNENRFNHLSYKPNKHDRIVISRPRQEPLSATASFAYNLILIIVLLVVFLPLLGIKINTHLTSLKHKIGWAMVSIVILSMVLVAIATIHYNIKNFEERNRNSLSEKLMSLQFELEQDLMFMNHDRKSIQYLNQRLIDLSNTFYTDINLYDTTGILLATSRSEIFDKKLTGRRMNPRAWHELHHLKSPKFIDSERLGKATFMSAYVPMINAEGSTVAYLNLPYFTKQEELRNELYGIIVALINIFALLALLSISLVVAITSQLTRPLELIRKSMSQVNISGSNDTIEYSGSDEVGQLIAEYNRMVKELARSAEELARNQRESAWREMAKQIAHEVKNPLTPIKLSLQHLVKAKHEGLPNWDERFERFAQSLTEQINALTVIANEFSSFAKLPSAKSEPVNLLSVLNDAITLHSGYKHVKILLTNNLTVEPVTLADKDQLIRVFNNLIKNGIQAIERGKLGIIDIKLTNTENNTVKIDINDNGVGIAEESISKIFTPNFTTKSGGTGLGLAITREIILNFGGSITFRSEVNKGTTFTVELPLYLDPK